MSVPMIDNVQELMKLNEDELNERLLEPKYNSSNLRELIRRSLGKAKEYEKAWEYENQKREECEEKLQNLKDYIHKI